MTDSNNMNVPVISLPHLFQANKHIRGVIKMYIVCRAWKKRSTLLAWELRAYTTQIWTTTQRKWQSKNRRRRRHYHKGDHQRVALKCREDSEIDPARGNNRRNV